MRIYVIIETLTIDFEQRDVVVQVELEQKTIC
jgi:hypothetical protein